MRIFFRLFAVIVALTILSELLVRAVLTMPAPSIPDDEFGWVYKPYSTIFFTGEGRATNKMNSMGFNDDDPDMDSEKLRVLMLGDSITAALQVPKSRNFTSITEEMAPCLDVFNAARNGLSPVHYPIVLSRVMESISPSLAVVVISPGDWSGIKDGNYDIIRSTDDLITGLRLNEKPLTKLRLKLDPVLSRSALAAYLVQRLNALRSSKSVKKPGKEKTKLVISEADEQRVQEILAYLLQGMKSKVPVAILYTPEMRYGVDKAATVSKESVEFERVIRSAANIVGVPVLSTEPYMEASYRDHGQPGVGFANKDILSGHLNKLGHKATARALLDLLASVGLQCPMTSALQED